MPRDPAPAVSVRAGAPRRAVPSLRERWLDARDRLLASPQFRRWAAAFPLTRPIARRRARAVFDLCGGFVYSQVLHACVELRLFALLAEGPQAVAALAPRLLLTEPAAARLLAAAAALRLVAPRGDGRYGLGPLGATLVDNGAVLAMIEHHAMLYRDLADPVALLRGNAPQGDLARYWPYAGSDRPAALDDAGVAPYTRLMAASQALVAGEVLDAWPLDRTRCLLDVGGGDGAFLSAAAARHPHLQVILFDLPPVAARARTRFAVEGMTARASAVGGDFLADPLPEGADAVSLVRVIHDHDDAGAVAILRAIRRVLPADGALLLAEPMSGMPGAEPVGDAYFGFYLLAMGRGRPRTPAALGALLRTAGFRHWRAVATRMPLQTGLVVANA